jgi:hypothetical protein
VGRVVRGVSCPWGEMSLGQNVRGARCPWGNVRGAKCPWGEMSEGRDVVGRVVVGQVLMGRVVLGRVVLGRVVLGRVVREPRRTCVLYLKKGMGWTSPSFLCWRCVKYSSSLYSISSAYCQRRHVLFDPTLVQYLLHILTEKRGTKFTPPLDRIAFAHSQRRHVLIDPTGEILYSVQYLSEYCQRRYLIPPPNSIFSEHCAYR